MSKSFPAFFREFCISFGHLLFNTRSWPFRNFLRTVVRIYLGQKDKIFYDFTKDHLRKKITNGGENPIAVCWVLLNRSQARNSPWGNPRSPQADGACWPRAGRYLRDAHSHIFLPLPSLQRPKRQFGSCNIGTPNSMQTIPCPMEDEADSLPM